MQQRVITYTPKENKDHPNFLPVIDMVQVIGEFDYWCEEDFKLQTGRSLLPNIDVEDYWANIGTNLDINIWRPEPEMPTLKITIYPVDDDGQTNSEEWCNIYEYTMDFLKSHPVLETHYIKQWFQGVSN